MGQPRDRARGQVCCCRTRKPCRSSRCWPTCWAAMMCAMRSAPSGRYSATATRGGSRHVNTPSIDTPAGVIALISVGGSR